MQTIEVTIGENGETEVAVKGVAGADCKKATADLEAALGKVTADKETAEMRLQAKQVARR